MTRSLRNAVSSAPSPALQKNPPVARPRRDVNDRHLVVDGESAGQAEQGDGEALWDIRVAVRAVDCVSEGMTDVVEFLEDIEPFLALITAVGTTVILVLIVRFTVAQVSAVKEQKGIVEERLLSSKDDFERTEKWHQRRVEELEERLATVMNDEGITESSLVADANVAGDQVRQVLEPIVGELRALLDNESGTPGSDSIGPATHLELGKAMSVSHEWLGAAEHLEAYLKSQPDDWQGHFLHGAALANSRDGDRTNLGALRAVSEAIALVPGDVDPNMLARLHTYRGAMLKRLRRFPEAESEFVLSLFLCSSDYDLGDLNYNLASLYALQGERELMLKHLRSIPVDLRTSLGNNPYFSSFANDREFIGLTRRESF